MAKKPVVVAVAEPPKKVRRAKPEPIEEDLEEEVEEEEVEEEEVEEEEVEDEEEVVEDDDEDEEDPVPAPKKKSKTPEPPAKKKTSGGRASSVNISDEMSPEDWQKVLDQMSSNGGPFYYLKDGKTRLRLVSQPGTKNLWFSETTNVFNGRSRPKVIFFAVLSAGKGVTEEMKDKVMPVVAAKTVVNGILSLLAEGYNLLSPAHGYGLTITRTGSGFDTAYSVLPSQKEIPLNPKALIWPETKVLADLAVEYAEKSAERDSGRAKSSKRKGGSEDEDDTAEW